MRLGKEGGGGGAAAAGVPSSGNDNIYIYFFFVSFLFWGLEYTNSRDEGAATAAEDLASGNTHQPQRSSAMRGTAKWAWDFLPGETLPPEGVGQRVITTRPLALRNALRRPLECPESSEEKRQCST